MSPIRRSRAVPGLPADQSQSDSRRAEPSTAPAADTGRGTQGEYCTGMYFEFETTKDGVTIRWLGTSNGYYNETADLKEWVKDEQGNACGQWNGSNARVAAQQKTVDGGTTR